MPNISGSRQNNSRWLSVCGSNINQGFCFYRGRGARIAFHITQLDKPECERHYSKTHQADTSKGHPYQTTKSRGKNAVSLIAVCVKRAEWHVAGSIPESII